MEVILLERMANLGGLGDTVKVKSGYGRNYLVPTGRAMVATVENRALIEQRLGELRQAQVEGDKKSKEAAQRIDGARIVMADQEGEQGKLYGSVREQDIAREIGTQLGVEISKHKVRLPEGPLRRSGEFKVMIHFYAELDATLTVAISIVGEKNVVAADTADVESLPDENEEGGAVMESPDEENPAAPA